MPKQLKAVCFNLSEKHVCCRCKSTGTCYYTGKGGTFKKQDVWHFVCKKGHEQIVLLSRGYCPFCGKEKKSHKRRNKLY